MLIKHRNKENRKRMSQLVDYSFPKFRIFAKVDSLAFIDYKAR
jgi:hypothetical protein